jgi:hypothetical protein
MTMHCRNFEEFCEGGKVEEDIAQVRFDYHSNKRRVKLLALHDELMKEKQEL